MTVDDLDTRPANCRNRQQDHGLPYPRSSCEHCGSLIRPNFKCPYDKSEQTQQNATKQSIITAEEARRLSPLDNNAITNHLKRFSEEIKKAAINGHNRTMYIFPERYSEVIIKVITDNGFKIERQTSILAYANLNVEVCW